MAIDLPPRIPNPVVPIFVPNSPEQENKSSPNLQFVWTGKDKSIDETIEGDENSSEAEDFYNFEKMSEEQRKGLFIELVAAKLAVDSIKDVNIRETAQNDFELAYKFFTNMPEELDPASLETFVSALAKSMGIPPSIDGKVIHKIEPAKSAKLDQTGFLLGVPLFQNKTEGLVIVFAKTTECLLKLSNRVPGAETKIGYMGYQRLKDTRLANDIDLWAYFAQPVQIDSSYNHNYLIFKIIDGGLIDSDPTKPNWNVEDIVVLQISNTGTTISHLDLKNPRTLDIQTGAN